MLFSIGNSGVDFESIKSFVHRVLTFVLQIFHLHCYVVCLSEGEGSTAWWQ